LLFNLRTQEDLGRSSVRGIDRPAKIIKKFRCLLNSRKGGRVFRTQVEMPLMPKNEEKTKPKEGRQGNLPPETQKRQERKEKNRYQRQEEQSPP